MPKQVTSFPHGNKQQKTSVDAQARTEDFFKQSETTNDHMIKKNASNSSFVNRAVVSPLIEPAIRIIHDSCVAEQSKRLRQKEAACLLGLSVRQVKRLWWKYRKRGAKGLLSARRGKASNHRLDAGVVQQALDLIQEKYSDFGPTLAHEKLVEGDRLRISRERVRQLMIEEGLWKPRRAKQAAVHQLRERRACFGELIQIDGSTMPGLRSVANDVRCWCSSMMRRASW